MGGDSREEWEKAVLGYQLDHGRQEREQAMARGPEERKEVGNELRMYNL